MRDIKLTIPAGETSHQEVNLRAWLVRSVETDDAVILVTREQGSLLIHTGQQVELDDAVQGFELINTTAAPVALHLQVAGKASIGSKKNDSGSGSGVDQVARDAAAAAQTEVDAVELEADQALAEAAANATDIDALRETPPFLQVLVDSGRLMAGQELASPSVSAIGAYNGASMGNRAANAAEVAQHRFFHNNSNAGGPAGPNSQIVEDLLTAMGRAGGSARRYGTEFYVAERQMVAAPATAVKQTDGGLDYFLATQSNARLVGFDGWVTCGAWVWAENVNEVLAWAPAKLVINGADVPSNKAVLAAGWNHISYQYPAASYVTSQPTIYGAPNAKFAVALPVVSGGRHVVPQHTSPIIKL